MFFYWGIIKNTLWFALLCPMLLLAGCASTSSGISIVPGVTAPGAQVELVREGFMFTEGPLPAPDGGLYFTDLRASRIHKIEPNGSISLYRENTNETNGLAYTRKGEMLGIEAIGKRVSRISVDGKSIEITRGDGSNALMMPNDLIADTKGGIYFTDPGPRPIPKGRKHHVYYLPPGASRAIIVDDSMTRPNGLTLTLDGKTLVVADTVEHDLLAFDIQADGTLRNRRPFLKLRGIPAGDDSGGDGMAIDSAGRFYVTSVPGVQVFDNSGNYLGNIPVPRKATNVAFSGPGKRTLYITAREGVYRVQTLVSGPDRPGK